MPFIPLPQNAPMGDVPAPVLNRERAPMVNLAGVQQGLGRLAAAGQSDMIPLAPFTAPGQGLQAVGDGMQSLSGVFAKLAEVKAEAKNDLDAATAVNALDMAYAEHEKRRQTLPADQWEDDWAKRSTAALAGVMANDKLAPVTRRRLELYGQKWSGQTAVRVARDATQTIGQRAEDEAFAGIQRSIDSGDLPGARARLSELGAAGKAYVNPGRIVETEHAIKAAEKQAEWSREYRAIHADADAYLAEHSGIRAGESPEEHSQRISEAQQTASQQYHEHVTGAMDAMAMAVEAPPESRMKAVQAFDAAVSQLSPAQALKARETYASMMDQKRKAELYKPEVVARNAGLLDDMVQDFDRNAPDARDRLYEIKRLTHLMLPEGFRQYITDPLDRKWFSKPPEPDKELEAGIMASIQGHYKAGAFGAVDKPITEGLNPITGQWEKVQDGMTYAKKREATEPLPEKDLDGPRAAKTSLSIHMRELLKQHPEWRAEPEKAWAALNAARNRQRSKGAPAINFTAPAPPALSDPGPPPEPKKKTAEKTGAANNLDYDLPGGGGPDPYDSSLGSVLLPPLGSIPPPP